jgi:hypothetical protein
MRDFEPAAGVALTADLTSDTAIPWFLWDEPMTVSELRRRLERSDADRMRLLRKILREARDEDVWLFTTPEEVCLRWPQLERHLGRRRDFWRFLLDQWRKQDLLVQDRAPQLFEKVVIGGIVVDPPAEILANKLCALLSRTEPRDLVDVAKLEEAGFDPIGALDLARRKDGGGERFAARLGALDLSDSLRRVRPARDDPRGAGALPGSARATSDRRRVSRPSALVF